ESLDKSRKKKHQKSVAVYTEGAFFYSRESIFSAVRHSNEPVCLRLEKLVQTHPPPAIYGHQSHIVDNIVEIRRIRSHNPRP
ncbi:MAG: hypothetical protein QNL95_02395, partial [OM182 bacterium]